MSIEAVEIVILGRPYKVSCPAGQQDALQAAAVQLTEKLSDLRQRSRVSSNEQLAIMAALNFCHELCLEKEKNHQYSETMDKRIKMLQQTIEAALVEHGRYGDSGEESESSNV
ncbi:cell division protein ZapA [Aeromonas simiae]|uniref:Cell division protein ZapA n=1 Tax=Aeromonas simiae TaxID=218936 RepID=A0A5J6X0A5_9GAMM|nr:cell division protein ZapA [Aeromonas simiae]MDO2947944.1 cell division protein ZapA [Aeromonas simiae]MDO2951776.1 cell division protein ZapA [Aeromonas simiae]MDO2955327.1 cell division protein ZapA [Aeromonas simiae]QFI55015.1 cell division protein ZapA [Aeromonas simiae]